MTVSRGSFAAATDFLSRLRSPVLISHSRPDGDAVGSIAALYGLSMSAGACPSCLLFEPMPLRYEFLLPVETIRTLPRETPADADPLAAAGIQGADGVILLDTCAAAQLSGIAGWLQRAGLPRLAVDHHVTRDDLADCYLVDESAAATCLLLKEWADAAGWIVAADVAEALFAGIATDTGWFQHSNTDERVFSACRDLIAAGVMPNRLYQRLYQREAESRIRLLGLAIESLELVFQGQVALMRLTAREMDAVGATAGDTEDIVNEPLRLGTVVASVLLVEQSAGRVRASLRSKLPLQAGDPDIDVAAIAATLGGGGHRRAAGVRMEGALQECSRMLTERFAAALGR